MRGRPAVQNVIVSALITGAAYVIFLGHRLDYAGHFLAGLGATLVLLCGLLMGLKRAIWWEAVGVTGLAIVLGFITESSIFRIAFFDPVDFVNQSLGACVACACVIGFPYVADTVKWLSALSLVIVAGGFILAFA